MTTAALIIGVIVATIWILLGNSMGWLNALLSLIPLVFLYLIVQFFRVPNRTIAGNSTEVVCPADGKVVVIERVYEPEFLKEDCIQISIFMSPLNVHANYVPITGNVVYTKYHEGSYLVAWHPKSSTENERSTMVIETSSKKRVLVRQIAGAVARRIVYYVKPGQRVERNEQFGFIKFGSRVDIFLPLGSDLVAQMGQITKGNETVIARW